MSKIRTSTLLLHLFFVFTLANPIIPRGIAQFPSGTPFDILLDISHTTLSQLLSSSSTTLDIDLFDNLDTIATLAKSKTIICYFSAGSRESWRSDANAFNSTDYGKAMNDWKGENWVDVKSENVRRVMKGRIETAKKAGCHAVDPDNVDGYNNNQDGFNYPPSIYAEYVNYLASVAHENGLAMGLKNALDIIPDVLSNIQFAVNEQCHAYGECARYAPLTKKGLAIFNIEYGNKDCGQPKGVKLSTVIKGDDQQLNVLGGQCT